MAKDISRRSVLKAAAAGAAVGTTFGAMPIRSWAAEPVKVGVILPTSGVYAFAGQQARKGAEFGAAYVAENKGPAMELIFADTESKPENGRVAVEKLVRQGCTALIGAWDTGATISAAQACEQVKVPLLINIGSAPQITEQGFTQIFRNFPPVTQMIGSAVTRIHELVQNQQKQPKTAVVLYVNDTFGQAALGGFEKIWANAKVPIKIVDKIGYDVRAKDLSVEVAKAKATGADLVLPITRTNDAIMIVREMVKQKYNPMAIIGPGSPGPYEKAFTDALGKYGDDYMICVPWWNPRNPRAQAIASRYEKVNTGARFELNSGFTFEAVEVMADALKRAKSADPAAIHAALKATKITDHVMYGGTIEFNEKGQNPNIGVALLQNRNGAPMVVGPSDVTMGAPIFPMRPFAERNA
jgi:branched-chain amino acid transport system substrate-binding protein